MELAVSGGSLRALHRSIAFLSRVGPEVLIDASARDETLTLKSVNAARSAFARVAVRASAFDAREITARGGRAQTCALAKHVMASLRSHARADVVVVTLDDEDDEGREARRLRVTTTSAKSGTKKTYEMHEVMDAEHVDAEIDAEAMPAKVVSRAKTLLTLLAHFSSAAREDVTLTCGIESDVCVDGDAAGAAKIVTLSSYLSPGGGLSQALQTSISLRRDDESILFYRNTAAAPVEVTVNLKDLRSIVQLCESSDVDVAIYCAQAGAPVVVKPTADFKMFHQRDAFGNQPQHTTAPASVDFEAELVLASMLPPEDASAVEPSQCEQPRVEAPAPLQNAPLGSQPWSAVPDSENASQREVGGGVDAPSRPWGREAPNDAATTVLNDNDDWAHDEFVEATPPEKRQRQ
ncbi:predicted protein [Ostreococcus lucimarinus CCE9901]|uniref:Uncharacterized protein n=1 Tax=Ostreococcus lucimarinus (strain CCE9901) TaxID=436017 RepID=A4RQK0_OSTLU|nr:predicted protein [Ostreococcus lucimarinus CCE9901]ABO94037.1 predicted protein [Ostreococcus lucimarinus CCE9901]|eukprot:XP_001415745.1 predicted protein [Ostreococcus lucimarinus CCE9901]